MLNIIIKTIKSASRSRLSMLCRRTYLKMRIPMDFPIIVNVDPTNACNLLCNMCPNSSDTIVKKSFMDMDLYRKIIDEIKQREKRLYRYFLVKDGEPLLHKNIRLNPYFPGHHESHQLLSLCVWISMDMLLPRHPFLMLRLLTNGTNSIQLSPTKRNPSVVDNTRVSSITTTSGIGF